MAGSLWLQYWSINVIHIRRSAAAGSSRPAVSNRSIHIKKCRVFIIKLQLFLDFTHPSIHSFIHYAVCLPTGPKRVLQWVRSGASSFKLQYLPFISKLHSSCLLLLPRLPFRPSFNHVLSTVVPIPHVTNPVSLSSFCCVENFSSLNLSTTSSFFSLRNWRKRH